MRVAVLGAGAVGSFVGARLSRAADVVLIGRAPHVRAIGRSGLRVEGLGRSPFHLEATTQVREARDADLVLLTTKSFDTRAAALQLRQAGLEAPVLSLQNGLTNLPVLRAALKRNPLLGGSIVVGVTTIGPGRIRYAGGGKAVVGPSRASVRLARQVASLFSRAGIPTRVTATLDRVLWQKAIVNAAVNPVTAVLRCTNGEVLSRPEARLVARLATEEAAAVARAHGIPLTARPWPMVEGVLRTTAGNRSSMLQDLEAGRPTEIEAITGEVVRVARQHAVPVPVNRALLQLVRSL
jgi:2-dehydropantoate 2-reductase